MKNARKENRRGGARGGDAGGKNIRGRGDSAPGGSHRSRLSESASKRWVWISLGIVLAATVATMGIGVRSDYVSWDDNDFLDRSPFVSRGVLKSLWLILTGQAYGDHAYYPTYQAFWFFDIVAFGKNPHLSHLLNLAIHLLNAGLAWQCIRLMLLRVDRLASRQVLLAACIGATLFGIHPVNVEPVTWVSGRKVELAFLFSMAAFLLLLARRGRWPKYALAVLCYALAVLSNASAFGFGLVFGAWWVLVERVKFLRSLALAAPFLFLVAFSGKMRFERHTPEYEVVSNQENYGARLAVGLAAHARETLDLVYPTRLVPVYPSMKGFFWTDFWTYDSTLGLLLMLAAGSLIVRYWVRGDPLQRMLAFGLAWYWLALAPTFAHHHAQADRHLYSSAIGLFMALGVLSTLWLDRLRGTPKHLAVTACAMAGLALAMVAARQASLWKNSKSLFGYTVRVTKENHVANANMGYILAEEGDLDAAIPHYRAALDFLPTYPEAHYNLGNALFEKGETEEAIRHFNLAVEQAPDDPKAPNNLGAALNSLGQIDKAESLFIRAIGMDPDYADAHHNLGIIYFKKGEADQAALEFQKAIELKPDYAEAYQNLGVALFGKGEVDKAVENFQRALAYKPNLIEANRNLATLYAQRGRLDEAQRYCENVVRLLPSDAVSHSQLAHVLERQGRIDDAVRAYGRALSILQAQSGQEAGAAEIRAQIEALQKRAAAPASAH